MADTEALEAMAELIPPERKERFYAVVNKFKNLREDDDSMQVLEAIGFMMLVMNEIPDKIGTIMKQAQRTLSEPESERLRTEVVEVLTNSLDTPSYKDLRETVRVIGEQEARLRQKVNEIYKRLSESEIRLKKRNSVVPNILNGLTGGLVGAALASICTFFIVDHFTTRKPQQLPKALQPYATLNQRGQLEYLETDLPEYGGEVSVYMIGGNVEAAFVNGDQGVVVCGNAKRASR